MWFVVRAARAPRRETTRRRSSTSTTKHDRAPVSAAVSQARSELWYHCDAEDVGDESGVRVMERIEEDRPMITRIASLRSPLAVAVYRRGRATPSRREPPSHASQLPHCQSASTSSPK